MKIPLHCKVWWPLIGGCLLLSGCVAPHYTNHQLILFGKAAPTIAGLDVAAIQKNLSTNPAPKVSRVTMLTDFSTIPLKCLGVQGWKDFHLDAEVRGTVVQHQLSSDRILTVDLRLNSLAINGTMIPLSGDRFIRAEIYRGKARVDKQRFAQKDAVMVVKGKLVWDTDGWFEIHPQGGDDVRFEATPDAPHTEADTLKRQQAVPQNADTSRPNPPAVRSWSGDPRVQSRTYVFTNTGETLPYAVFVSTKVAKGKPAPLIVALRGAGGNPGVFMHEPALKLAEEGGYIMVAPMGYSAMANFGNPAMAMGMGGFGRRGGAPTNAPGIASQLPGTNQPPGGPQPDRGMGMPAGGGADQSKASEYSEQDVMNVLAMVRKEFNIDNHRIYLMGHSQGGAGALHIADKYSSIWAAVAGLSPGAPGFQLDANARFKDVPVLLIVGDKDGFIGSVQRLDERMKSLNIPHEYMEVPGKDHGGIIMGGMTNVFQFFGQHTKP